MSGAGRRSRVWSRGGVRRSVVWTVAAAVLVAVVVAWMRRAPRPSGPRLVVLYVACTVKSSYLQPYNDAVDYTPNFAEFGRKSVVFRRHMTEAGQSGIAFASIFSGAQALRHGAFWHPVKLSDRLYEVSEAFRDAGYDTFYWAGHPMVPAKLGYARGVRVTYPRSVRDMDGYTATNDPDFTAILDHLGADRTYRAFVQIALTLTHAPYDGNVSREDVATFMREHPDEAAGISDADVDRFIRIYHDHVFDLQWDYDRTIADLGLGADDVQMLGRVVKLYYMASIHRSDAYFGKFVQQIHDSGLDRESIIAFTADHGETMGDNRLYHWTHGFQLTPGTLSVPWIVYAPGRVVPHAYEGVTRSIDVYPTLAGLSGLHIPSGAPVDGTDLSEAVLGRRPEPPIRAYFHTAALGSDRYASMRAVEPVARFYPGPDVAWIWVGLREGDTVYQWRNLDGREWGAEVFDLATDRTEARNLFNAADPVHARMIARLLAYKRRLVKAHERLGAMPGQPTSEENQRRLRALGYIP